MTRGTGRTCRTCNGSGEVVIAGTVKSCPPCFGTGEEQPERTPRKDRDPEYARRLNERLHKSLPNICCVCSKPYHGERHCVAGLVVCRNQECIEKAENIWG